MDPALDFNDYQGSLPRVRGIAGLSPAEAYACLGQGAALVDLREAYETNFRVFDAERVFYMPWSRFRDTFAALPRDLPLILADAAGIYCREAAAILQDAGYANVAKLSGGMIDWYAAGLPVRKDSAYELSGQCACKLKTRVGNNPLIARPGPRQGPGGGPAGLAPAGQSERSEDR